MNIDCMIIMTNINKPINKLAIEIVVNVGLNENVKEERHQCAQLMSKPHTDLITNNLC